MYIKTVYKKKAWHIASLFFISANIFCIADTNPDLNNDRPFSSLIEPNLETTQPLFRRLFTSIASRSASISLLTNMPTIKV